MGGLLFDEGDDLGSLVADHGEERREVGGGDAVEAVDGVDGEGLADAAVQGGGAEALEAVGGGGVELERTRSDAAREARWRPVSLTAAGGCPTPVSRSVGGLPGRAASAWRNAGHW